MLTLPGTELSYNVLYVADNPKTLPAFRQAFEDIVTLTVADTRQAALLALREGHTIDLVLFDDTLDSQAFLNAIQSGQHLRGLPVIVLTDQPAAYSATNPLREYVLDIFSSQDSQRSIRTRLTYLIQKKRYVHAKQTPAERVSLRMPPGKRAFDVVVAGTALAVLSPLLAVVAVLVKLDSKGPTFYRSKRVGMGYRTFDMYKFRTMRTGADKLLAGMASQNLYNNVPVEESVFTLCDVCQSSGTNCQRPLFTDKEQQQCEDRHHRDLKAKAIFSKFKEDPRITTIGRFLRNTSIDELPQLINILKGDMSFVGNRPLPPYEAEKLTTTGSAQRFAAPAGLTGLWQVTKRGKASVSDLERIQLDVEYAKRYSLLTDLRILLRTVVALWQKENV